MKMGEFGVDQVRPLVSLLQVSAVPIRRRIMNLKLNEAADTLFQALAVAANNHSFGEARDILNLIDKLADMGVDLAPAFDQLNANEVKAYTTQGKIYAIREHRARTKLGLKESKDIVEAYAKAHNLNLPPPRLADVMYKTCPVHGPYTGAECPERPLSGKRCVCTECGVETNLGHRAGCKKDSEF